MSTWKTYLFFCMFCCFTLLSVGCSQTVAVQPKKLVSPKLLSSREVFSPPATALLQGEDDVPVRLIIPAIQVDALIETVSVLNSGDLDTPRQQPWTDVGWYNASPDPGNLGSAVIDGHLDRPGGFPAVFWNLRNLQAGNQLKVLHRSGKMSVFTVNSVASYPVNAVPLQAIFGNGAGKYLNLITCAGGWLQSQHQTTLRMVVYASLMQ